MMIRGNLRWHCVGLQACLASMEPRMMIRGNIAEPAPGEREERASMEPRMMIRGNGVLAGPPGPRRGCFNGAADDDPRKRLNANSRGKMRSSLQWSRG